MNHEQELKPVAASITVKLFDDGTCSLQYSGETNRLLLGLQLALKNMERSEGDAT
ncbi:hypothetical protein [Chromobacterium subtsugae]|uniref:hypothetical protein n=1 Tax=Chromobacterium subtsugae TaxID=251747 RepID=UPI000ADDC53A|nr:hypothetical protein [Chromobacterium subtsugae]